VAHAFKEFALHVLNHQQRGHLVPDNQPWAHTRGYMRWFIRVSHPIVNPLRPFLTTQLRPLLVLSLLTRRFLLSSSGPNILPTHTRSSVTSEPKWTVQWGILTCFIIPEEVIRLMQGIQSEWSMQEQMSAREGEVGVHGMDQYDLCSFFMTFC